MIMAIIVDCPVENFLDDRWWWSTILGMVGEHPGNGALPFLGMWVTIIGNIGVIHGSYPLVLIL